jgi:hypothetical protein
MDEECFAVDRLRMQHAKMLKQQHEHSCCGSFGSQLKYAFPGGGLLARSSIDLADL